MKMSLRCVLDTMKESFFVIGRFIRTLESKIYEHIIVVSQNIYINKLEKIVDKYNETCHERVNRKFLLMFIQAHLVNMVLSIMTKILISELMIVRG